MARKKAETAEEKPTAGIIMLPVAELHPHPDNPRKELGDLEQLSEDVRKNGIRQNLTVVKADDGYKIIIGHRRHAAAALAGLETVPCIIAEMTEREQLETMLTENLMREDLKLSEQVRTFEQLRLEGADAEDIAKTTGFSASYVAKRLKYASAIGADNLKEIEKRAEDNDRQLTLDEIDKLCSIKSPSERRKLSESVGTNNFSWEYRAAKTDEQAREKVAEARKILKERGYTELLNSQTANNMYTTKNRFYIDNQELISNPDKALGKYIPKDNTEPVYFVFMSNKASWFYICIGEPKAPEEQEEKKDESAEKQKRAEEQELKEELSKVFERAYSSRWDFVNDLISGEFDNKEINSAAAEFIAYAVINQTDPEIDDLADMLDLPKTQNGEDVDDVEARICNEAAIEGRRSAEAALCTAFKVAYIGFCDSARLCTWNFKYSPENIAWLKTLYGFLERMGYIMSDEEKALIDGTHELYRKEDV